MTLKWALLRLPGGDGSRRRREEADALEDKAASLEAQQAQRAAQVRRKFGGNSRDCHIEFSMLFALLLSPKQKGQLHGRTKLSHYLAYPNRASKLRRLLADRKACLDTGLLPVHPRRWTRSCWGGTRSSRSG